MQGKSLILKIGLTHVNLICNLRVAQKACEIIDESDTLLITQQFILCLSTPNTSTATNSDKNLYTIIGVGGLFIINRQSLTISGVFAISTGVVQNENFNNSQISIYVRTKAGSI